MNFLATPLRRRILFSALYLGEGAPIGFLWLALPTMLRSAGVPIERITWLTAVLVIPWTFKFAWAPLVDVLRSPRWTFRHWAITAQVAMGATLCPLIWLNPTRDFALIIPCLIAHAFAAATQDVAIDALCIAVTDASERGRLNGWMQAGMLAGRAAMGGGALILAAYVGEKAVVLLLVAITTFSGVLLFMSNMPHPLADSQPQGQLKDRISQTARELYAAFRQRNSQIGLLFALIGPAAFKSLEVVIGPFLIDRGYSEEEVGQFSAVVMIGAMVFGSVLGGILADRFSRRAFVAGSLAMIVALITALGLSDLAYGGTHGMHLPILIGAVAFGIGVFTVAAYAMYMDFTTPAVAATQFSAFMGATNGCEAWSTWAMGQIIAARGYPPAMFVMCGASLLALPLLAIKTRPSGTTVPMKDATVT